MRTTVQIILAFCLSLLMVGCDSTRYFEKSVEVSDKTWDLNDKFAFQFEVSDTINTYDFLIDLRNSAAYPYANIWVFVDYTYPNKMIKTDTIECPLATPEGQWIGSGIGDIIDNRILFKKGVRFPLSGSYEIAFRHGMRKKEIPHILDVGLRVQHSR